MNIGRNHVPWIHYRGKMACYTAKAGGKFQYGKVRSSGKSQFIKYNAGQLLCRIPCIAEIVLYSTLTIFETGILQKESENIIFLMQCSTDPQSTGFRACSCV